MCGLRLACFIIVSFAELLAEKISKSRKFSLLTEGQTVTSVRLLTRQPQISDSVYKALSKALKKIEDSDNFFVAMDALVSLHKNGKLTSTVSSQWLGVGLVKWRRVGLC